MNLWFCLETLSYTQRWAGRLATARSLEDEAQTIRDAIGLGQAWKFPRIEMMALRGQDSELRQAIEANTNLINGEGLGVSSATYQLAMAFHALSRGQYDDAYRLARIIYDEDAPLYGNQILPELVEAAVRVGEFDVARATVHRLKVRALASGTNWARGLLLRSQGLLAVGDHAESCYQGAIDHLRRARVPLDHARAHLLYGEWLRRKRRIEDAATQLHVAHDMFAAAGAGGFADRAHSELSAAGGHAGRRVVEDDRVLTPQEEQVSRLAARGMTNKEIAATLFISESTAAYHLKKVFRKLNLTSRRELRRRLIE
jgi:DNA-binding CsgD family transcriptional regulator